MIKPKSRVGRWKQRNALPGLAQMCFKFPGLFLLKRALWIGWHSSVWTTESTQVAKHAPPPHHPPTRRLVSASDTEIMFKNDSPSSVAVTGMWQKAATTWKSCSTSVCDNPDQKVTDFKRWQEAWSFDSYIFVPECVSLSTWVFYGHIL